MITAAVILAIIILFLLLRFGVSAEYGADGFTVSAKAGPLMILLYPRKEKPGAAEKKALRKARKAEKTGEIKEKPKTKMPGGLQTYLDMLPPVKDMLGRIRRRLLIKKLTIHYTAAGSDAATTALTFGGANAVFGALAPLLENSFRVKRRDFRAAADFTGTEQKIYLHAAISIAVWELFYVVFALYPIIAGFLKPKPKPAVKPGTKPEARPGTKPAAKPGTKPAARPAAKPAAKLGTKAGKDEKKYGQAPDK